MFWALVKGRARTSWVHTCRLGESAPRFCPHASKCLDLVCTHHAHLLHAAARESPLCTIPTPNPTNRLHIQATAPAATQRKKGGGVPTPQTRLCFRTFSASALVRRCGVDTTRPPLTVAAAQPPSQISHVNSFVVVRYIHPLRPASRLCAHTNTSTRAPSTCVLPPKGRGFETLS